MSVLGVGVVGGGALVELGHLPAIASLPGQLRIAGCHDPSSTVAEALGRAARAEVMGLDELVSTSDIVVGEDVAGVGRPVLTGFPMSHRFDATWASILADLRAAAATASLARLLVIPGDVGVLAAIQAQPAAALRQPRLEDEVLAAAAVLADVFDDLEVIRGHASEGLWEVELRSHRTPVILTAVAQPGGSGRRDLELVEPTRRWRVALGEPLLFGAGTFAIRGDGGGDWTTPARPENGFRGAWRHLASGGDPAAVTATQGDRALFASMAAATKQEVNR